jgi:hypothetical protein
MFFARRCCYPQSPHHPTRRPASPPALPAAPHFPPSKEVEDELWWEATFDVPTNAAVISFCVNAGDTWDNNNKADHKVGG